MLCEFADWKGSDKVDIKRMLQDKSTRGSGEFRRACRDFLELEKKVEKKAEDETVDDAGEVGPLEFETSCNHCGNLDINHIVDIDKRKGTILCSSCAKGYVAKIPDDEYTAALKEARDSEKK